MSSMVTSVLNLTYGLLLQILRDLHTAEKLKHGDLTGEKCLQVFLRELDDLTRKDLLRSICFLKDGLRFLNLSQDETTDGETMFAEEHKEDMVAGNPTVFNEACSLSLLKEIRKLNITSTHFTSAKRSFEKSNIKATEAFNNESLSIDDRILATKMRVMTKILESLEDPDAAADACMGYLKELHDLPAIQEIFSVQLSGRIKSLFNKAKRREKVAAVTEVTMINFMVFDFVKNITKTHEVPNWPTIQVGKLAYNPMMTEGETRTVAESSVTWYTSDYDHQMSSEHFVVMKMRCELFEKEFEYHCEELLAKCHNKQSKFFKDADSFGSIPKILVSIGSGIAIVMAVPTLGITSFAAAAILISSFVVMKIDENKHKKLDRDSEEVRKFGPDTLVLSMVKEVGQELSRMFEDQLFHLTDDQDVTMMACCAGNLMFKLEEGEKFSRNNLLKKVISGKMRGQSLKTNRNNTAWKIPDVFQKPGLRKEVATSSPDEPKKIQIQFKYLKKPDDIRGPDSYGYRGQILEMVCANSESVDSELKEKDGCGEELQHNNNVCTVCCSSDKDSTATYFKESEIDRQYTENCSESSQYQPFHCLVQCPGILKNVSRQEDSPGLTLKNHVSEMYFNVQNKPIKPVYRSHSPRTVRSLCNADLSGSDFSRVHFANCTLEKCVFKNCTILFGQLKEVNLRGSCFQNSRLSYCNLVSAQAQSCQWTTTKVLYCCLDNADLRGGVNTIGGNDWTGSTMEKTLIGNLLDAAAADQNMERDLVCGKRSVCEKPKEKTNHQQGVRELAVMMKYEKNDIKVFLQSDNPTYAILQDWGKGKESKVGSLVNLLEKMGRNDVIEVLKQSKNMVMNLEDNIRQRMCEQLNQKTTKSKGFRKLAELVGYNNDEIEDLEKEENPTDVLLKDWQTKSTSTVEALIKLLNKMKRNDVIQTLNEAIHMVKNIEKPIRDQVCEMLNEDAAAADQNIERDLVCGKKRSVCEKPKEKTSHQQGVRELAVMMKYEDDEIEDFLQSDNPTYAILQDWGKGKQRKVENLVNLLEKMGRNDVIEVLKQSKNMVMNLEDNVRQRMCEQLNKKTIKSKGFRKLAELVGYNDDHIDDLAKEENPTDVLLEDWQTESTSTVEVLIELLNEMKRNDVIQTLNEVIHMVKNIEQPIRDQVCEMLNEGTDERDRKKENRDDDADAIKTDEKDSLVCLRQRDDVDKAKNSFQTRFLDMIGPSNLILPVENLEEILTKEKENLIEDFMKDTSKADSVSEYRDEGKQELEVFFQKQLVRKKRLNEPLFQKVSTAKTHFDNKLEQDVVQISFSDKREIIEKKLDEVISAGFERFHVNTRFVEHASPYKIQALKWLVTSSKEKKNRKIEENEKHLK